MWKIFEKRDLGNFVPHHTVDKEQFRFLEHADNVIIKSLVRGDEVRAIVYFRNTEGRDWVGAIFICEDFNARDGLKIKRYIQESVFIYQPLSVITVSKDEEYLESWHLFLNMTSVGLTRSPETNEVLRVWSVPRWVLKQWSSSLSRHK